MRRLTRTLIPAVLLVPIACTDPPKPEKATDLEKIEPAEGQASGSALGAVPTGPVAVVDGKPIANEEFRSIYDLKLKKYQERGRDIPSSADRRYRKSIIERLIHQEVLRQEAEKQAVVYDEKALEERMEQQKRGIRDWDKHLERRGETEKSLRDMYIAELLERAILEKQGKLDVSEDEIKAEYEKIKANYKSDKPRVRAAHILVPVGPAERVRSPAGPPEEPSDADKKKWEAEAKAKADELHKLVTSSATDFDAVAKEQSTGPSAGKGGDLGIFTADRMVEEFSEVAFKLKPGEISKPVKTKFGYHIIKVTGKWGPGELPIDALRDQIVERLQMRKLHQGRRDLKEQLLASYQVTDNIAPTLGPEPERPKPAAGRASPVQPGHDSAAPAEGVAKNAPSDPPQ